MIIQREQIRLALTLLLQELAFVLSIVTDISSNFTVTFYKVLFKVMLLG